MKMSGKIVRCCCENCGRESSTTYEVIGYQRVWLYNGVKDSPTEEPYDDHQMATLNMAGEVIQRLVYAQRETELMDDKKGEAKSFGHQKKRSSQ